MGSEVIDRDLAVFAFEQILDYLVGAVEVQCVRMVEVVVLCIVMLFLSKPRYHHKGGTYERPR